MAFVAITPTDLKANYLIHKEEIEAAIAQVLESGWYILGHQVTAFEQEFAAYLGVAHTVGVANGTDALYLALRACNIGPGDGVITTSHTAVATVAAVELTGAIPVLVDIDPATFTMDPECLENTIKTYNSDRQTVVKNRLKAIIPVHLYGRPADMTTIMDIAERYSLYVIEDCAQSHGATVKGYKTGSWGQLATFSFYPTKNLGALGDGGAIATKDSDLRERVRLLREYGWRERYISILPGLNSRLDELQAAILRVKLQYLDDENTRRREIARIYHTLLSETTLSLPQPKNGVKHVYHQYVIRSKHRDELRKFLKTNSIDTLIHYPMPVHLQPAYQERIVIGEGGLQYTEQICQEILSLPIHPQMTNEQVQRVGELIVRWHTMKNG